MINFPYYAKFFHFRSMKIELLAYQNAQDKSGLVRCQVGVSSKSNQE